MSFRDSIQFLGIVWHWFTFNGSNKRIMNMNVDGKHQFNCFIIGMVSFVETMWCSIWRLTSSVSTKQVHDLLLINSTYHISICFQGRLIELSVEAGISFVQILKKKYWSAPFVTNLLSPDEKQVVFSMRNCGWFCTIDIMG
jgi:hypothetical protein